VKIRIEFEGDYYEDGADLRTFILAREYMMCIHDVRDRIRTRLKYAEDVSEKEEAFLEELRALTFIDMEKI